MNKIEKNDHLTQSSDIIEHNLSNLQRMFPDAFTENKIDFEVLRQLLGGALQDTEEKYGLNWYGKRKARQIALTPSTATLRPCPGSDESVNWETTKNLLIEGDNLEVLKLLQKSYSNKIKLIYIDPPYNTGKDFVYPDNFRDSIGNYLEITGQVEGGKKMSANAETSGRFHTDWLNMLYPRLKLSRSLLREDGMIFISCDDSELHHLRLLVCEIFGEENVIATIANINNPKGRSDDRFVATSHEYLVVVAKNIDETKWGGFEAEEHITKRYNKTDEAGLFFREMDLRKTGDSDRRSDRPDMFYYFYYSPTQNTIRVSKSKDISIDDEKEIIPLREDGVEGRWRWGFETASKNLNNLLVRFMPNRQIWGVFEKDYLEGRSLVKPTSSWAFKEVNSERGSEQFVELGFPKESFPRPKPLGTIERILDIGANSVNEEDIILDFFAGSGTTGHAIMKQNSIDNGNRRFILVQLPEPVSPDKKEQESAAKLCDTLKKSRTISEITKERLRRAGKAISSENPQYSGDVGFRVFKLDKSNIRNWSPDQENLKQTLLDHQKHILEGRTQADIVYELLLKLGLDLCVDMASRVITGKTVGSVGGGILLLCLAEQINADEVDALANGIVLWHKELAPIGESTVVFLDDAFADDVTKTNLSAILNQYGLYNVRSL